MRDLIYLMILIVGGGRLPPLLLIVLVHDGGASSGVVRFLRVYGLRLVLLVVRLRHQPIAHLVVCLLVPSPIGALLLPRKPVVPLVGAVGQHDARLEGAVDEDGEHLGRDPRSRRVLAHRHLDLNRLALQEPFPLVGRMRRALIYLLLLLDRLLPLPRPPAGRATPRLGRPFGRPSAVPSALQERGDRRRPFGWPSALPSTIARHGGHLRLGQRAALAQAPPLVMRLRALAHEEHRRSGELVVLAKGAHLIDMDTLLLPRGCEPHVRLGRTTRRLERCRLPLRRRRRDRRVRSLDDARVRDRGLDRTRVGDALRDQVSWRAAQRKECAFADDATVSGGRLTTHVQRTAFSTRGQRVEGCAPSLIGVIGVVGLIVRRGDRHVCRPVCLTRDLSDGRHLEQRHGRGRKHLDLDLRTHPNQGVRGVGGRDAILAARRGHGGGA